MVFFKAVPLHVSDTAARYTDCADMVFPHIRVKRAQDGWGRAQRGGKRTWSVFYTEVFVCECRVNAAADGGAEKMEHVKCMSVQYVKVHMGFSEGRGSPREESGKCRVSLPIPLAVRAWYW